MNSVLLYVSIEEFYMSILKTLKDRFQYYYKNLNNFPFISHFFNLNSIMAFKTVKKNCLCFELYLQSKTLSMLESLYLELNIFPENTVEIPADSSHHESMTAMMKFSLF